MYKRILVTATTFPRWANDTEPGFVFYLSNLLAEKGHKVAVLVPHHLNAKRYELMGNVKIYRFPYFLPYSLQRLCYDGGILENLKKSNLAKLQAPLLFLMEFLYMNKIIRKEKIELVHAHWILPQGILAAICKKFFKIPFVVTVHAGDIFPIRNFFFRFLSKITLENCDYCTTNSTYTKNAVLRLANPKNIGVIPMGVSTTLFNRHKKNPDLKIIYITSEEFTNEVVEAIRGNDTARMKKKFRNVNLLIIDDVQFFAGKEKVQEELFHTFNILVDKSSQIVLSSDRPSFEIKKLEKRLSSRFSGGLTVDIAPPDFELRAAILLIKAKKYGIDLSVDIAKKIAEKTQDTRALEGYLLRVITEAKTKRTEITPELAEAALSNNRQEQKRPRHPDDLIKEVCAFYNIKPLQIKSAKRNAYLVKARQICMYLLKNDLRLTFAEIGNLLGGRDHTTIMHGVEKIEKKILKKEDNGEIMGIISYLNEHVPIYQ